MQSWNIEKSKKMYEVMTEIFTSLNLEIPIYITSKDMQLALNRMNNVLKSAQIATKQKTEYEIINQKLKSLKHHSDIRTALIISPVGIIRYQLKTILASKKIQSSVNDNLFRGLADYVKKLHDVIIIDIAKTNTIDDASSIIEEIKRISDVQNLDASIFVLISEYEKDLREKLFTFGVDRVIVKSDNWYDKLLNEIANINRIPSHFFSNN
ncbi:MAG: hypothetical protein AB7V50_02685 [Vampirovibrionia bacterium]